MSDTASRADVTDGADAAQAGVVLSARPGVDLQVQLATLLGENDHPGHSVDLRGAVPPHIARRVAATQRGGQWVFAVCDTNGHLTCSGTTRHRPDHSAHHHPGGTLELRMTESQLTRWRTRPPAGWEKLITDIGRYVDRWPDILARINGNPERRFPGEELRCYVQLRDQFCQGPGGCGAPARHCDWEHSLEHDRGGETNTDNGRAQCRHDHLLKTKGNWTVRTLDNGGLEWTSPLGQHYTSRPEPLMCADSDTPPF